MIQSVLFNKAKWSLEDAQKWLESHFHTSGKLSDISKYYRYTQFSPSKELKYRTHSLGATGIKLILGYPSGQEGEGIYSAIKDRVKLFMKGPKTTAANKVQRVLDKELSPIAKLYVNRSPVQSGVAKVMNYLSQGRLEAKRKELGYDEIWHAFLVIELEDGKKFRLEKNHTVEIRGATNSDLEGAKNIPINKKLTMKALVAQAAAGANNKLFEYSASNNNCQNLVQQVVHKNGLAESAAVQKLVEPQDSQKLVGTLGVLAPITDLATGLAARGQRVINGDGIAKGKKNKSIKKNYISL
jgi:hypothetical protein